MEDRLVEKQQMVIAHILSSKSIEEACDKAGISRTAYYSWLKDDAFKQELKRQRDELIEYAMGKLKLSVTKAVDELVGLMNSKREDIRRGACRDIIEYALKAIELEDIGQRLEKVERIILEKKTYR